MEKKNRDEEKRIFQNELYTLKQLGYLELEDYEMLTQAHNQYHVDLLAKEKQPIEVHRNTKNIASESKAPKAPAHSKKKEKTQEEIRERNISWLLNLGVILLLIGGLFVATSNWSTMSEVMKTGSILIVSLLFFGIAFIASKLLKIEKTAFAFVVLGSLFIPIFIFSLGWFGLLGSYLSIAGEGKFVLGMLGSLILVPVYGRIARKLESRLFVWFAFLFLTFGVAFLLRAIGLNTDGFYFGMAAYNGFLITSFLFMKQRGKAPLFTKELASFAQVNLILTTLMMVLFFKNHLFYGLNLLLTASMYLAMIYVSRVKEYHFVFSTMMVYGAYQIIENWWFQAVSPVGYALLGLIFLFVPRLLDDALALAKVFKWTSAVVSGLAFIYITLEGMLFRASDPSFILMFAYVIIAAHFVYLAYSEKSNFFRYLSPFFLASALFEGMRIVDHWMDFDTFTLPFYFVGLILFIVFGWYLPFKWIKEINQSSRDVGLGIMGFAIAMAIVFSQWGQIGIMLLLLTGVIYLIRKIEERNLLQKAAPWVMPTTLGFAFVCFSQELSQASIIYKEALGVPFHFAGAGMVLLLSAWSFQKMDEKKLAVTSFFIAEGVYAWGLFLSFSLPMDETWARPILWLTGIYLFYLVYQKTPYKWMRFVMAFITLVSYFIIQIPLHREWVFTKTMESFVLIGGGVILLLVALSLVRKKRELADGYAWVGHIYLIPVLLLTYFAFGADSTWPLFLAFGLYAGTLKFVRSEWMRKAFLYATFTSLFLTMDAGLRLFANGQVQFAFLLTSILIGLFWYISQDGYKQSTIYYLVPFSILGLASFLSFYSFSWNLYLITLCYGAGVILLLHQTRLDIILLLPLLIVFTATLEVIVSVQMNVIFDLLVLAGMGLIMLILGRTIYEKLWEYGEKRPIKYIDSYTLTALLYFASLYLFSDETYWAGIYHGLLISLTLWLQRHRVPVEFKWIPTFSAGMYLLLPYYTMVQEVDIHPLWLREVYVLPWVALTIYLQLILKGRWKRVTSYIQWIVLFFVFLLLVQDGLSSSTIYDALILGTLSLGCLLAGVWLRIKAYFFIGSGVLLLNVFLQTRPYWGNLPWWGYLLLAGSLLITVASLNEWSKQKAAKGEKSFMTKLIERIIGKLKQWN